MDETAGCQYLIVGMWGDHEQPRRAWSGLGVGGSGGKCGHDEHQSTDERDGLMAFQTQTPSLLWLSRVYAHELGTGQNIPLDRLQQALSGHPRVHF